MPRRTPTSLNYARDRHRQCNAHGHGAIQIYDQDRDQSRVPNRGTAPAISDVVAGTVDLMFHRSAFGEIDV